jgi:hypothetical protein
MWLNMELLGNGGEWIVDFTIHDADRATSLAPLWDVLQLASPLGSPLHRLRKAVSSWGEFDSNGSMRASTRRQVQASGARRPAWLSPNGE